jgi:GNAT superfamily N-acetyltransferase
MQFVDKVFARRLESAEEMPQVDCVRTYQEIRPEMGAAFEPICGGHMMFAGLNSPIGHAAGMGFNGPVKDTDLDRLEAFYRSHGAPAQLDICPLTDPSLLELVKARGYGIFELNNVLYRVLEPGGPSVRVPAGVRIRPGRPEEAGQFSDIVSRSFFEKGDAPEGFAEMLAPLFRFPGSLTFVASVDENPVAAAAGRVIPEHRVFALFGAGTLPEFRGRGIQTALLQTRMQAAAEAGCELIVVVTQGGSISERNCVRLGFRIAYSKATVIKNFPAEG